MPSEWHFLGEDCHNAATFLFPVSTYLPVTVIKLYSRRASWEWMGGECPPVGGESWCLHNQRGMGVSGRCYLLASLSPAPQGLHLGSFPGDALAPVGLRARSRSGLSPHRSGFFLWRVFALGGCSGRTPSLSGEQGVCYSAASHVRWGTCHSGDGWMGGVVAGGTACDPPHILTVVSGRERGTALSLLGVRALGTLGPA